MTSLTRLAAVLFPALLVAAAMAQGHVDPRLLFLDPMVAVEVAGHCCKTYYGIMSTLGVLMWIATAGVCLFAASVLWRALGWAPPTLFALAAGMLTAWLGLDDAFLFHENIAPKIGIPQTVVLAAYVLLALAYVAVSARQILAADAVLFVLAGGFLAASLGIDIIFHSTDSFVVALEDGAKFIGIACWMMFHVTAMARLMGARQDGGHAS